MGAEGVGRTDILMVILFIYLFIFCFALYWDAAW